MTVDVLLIIAGFICIITGIAGCILPGLPGIPFSYLGVLLLHFTSQVEFSHQFLVGWAIVVVAVQLLDYYIPIWGTKKLGGGKKGARGSLIGIVLGIFIFPPWGMIICPFAGAVVGELLDDKPFDIALKAGFGAFIGFVAGTLAKLIVALVLTFYFLQGTYQFISSLA